MLLLYIGAATAQAPLPPQRPAHLSPRPAIPSELPPAPAMPPPQTTGSIAPAAAPAQTVPLHPLSEPGALVARRAAIRACADEWQKMKRDGFNGPRLWRDFSAECLARRP